MKFSWFRQFTAYGELSGILEEAWGKLGRRSQIECVGILICAGKGFYSERGELIENVGDHMNYRPYNYKTSSDRKECYNISMIILVLIGECNT